MVFDQCRNEGDSPIPRSWYRGGEIPQMLGNLLPCDVTDYFGRCCYWLFGSSDLKPFSLFRQLEDPPPRGLLFDVTRRSVVPRVPDVDIGS